MADDPNSGPAVAKPPVDPVRKMFSVMLMIVGLLVMILCGLCSLGVLGVGVVSAAMSPREMMSGLTMVSVFGGIPFAVGLGFFLLGRAIGR